MQFLHTKKGGAGPIFNTIIVIILLMVGFFFASLIMKSSLEGSADVVIDKTCQASVLARANAHNAGAGGAASISGDSPLLCKTKRKEIDVKTEEEAKNILAGYMLSCWQTFGSGKLPYTIESDGNADTCFPCYVITINQIKEGTDISGSETGRNNKNPVGFSAVELEQTLKEKKVGSEQGEISYYDMITNNEGIPGTIGITDEIKEHEVYQILYSDPETNNKHFADFDSQEYNGIYLLKLGEKSVRKSSSEGNEIFECEVILNDLSGN